MEKRRALFTLHIVEGAADYAQALTDLGWEIVATSETSSLLRERRIPVVDIEDFTGVREKYGFPPTLHPKMEAYLTGSSGPRIDLVYAIPYPLSVGNDVGGRTLLALAAKGKRIPVMCRTDMESVLAELRKSGDVSEATRRHLLDKTHAAIAGHYLSLLPPDARYDGRVGEFSYELRNGENPYQVPAALFDTREEDPLALPKFQRLSGEAPCLTNAADADSILHLLCLAAEAFRRRYGKVPYLAAAAKHGNACGMAASWQAPAEAVEQTLFGNPRAIWGGEFVANFPVDDAVAGQLLKSARRERMLGSSPWMLDIVLAPGFSSKAVETLGKRAERKLMANEALAAPALRPARWMYRPVRGGFLRQPPNHYVLDLAQAELAGEPAGETAVDSLIIAWAVAWNSNHGGNETALACDRHLAAAGGGPSTADAVEVAIMRARSGGHELSGSAFAANAFFPFTDGPELLVKAGVKAGVVPAGGKQEPMVRRFFADHRVSVYYLPPEYRGFSRH